MIQRLQTPKSPLQPSWLREVNEHFVIAKKQLLATHKDILLLINCSESDEKKGYYSAEALQDYVNKKNETKKVLEETLKKIQEYDDLIEMNESIYQSKKRELNLKENMFDLDKHYLIENLIEWEQGTEYSRYQKALIEFSNILNLDSKAQPTANKMFHDQYGDVVELVFDKQLNLKLKPLKPIIDTLKNYRSLFTYEKLNKYTLLELKRIADVTNDALIAKAQQLFDNSESYQKELNEFNEKAFAEIKKINKEEFDLLNIRSKELAQDYELAIQTLSVNSLDTYCGLNIDVNKLINKIISIKSSLVIAHMEFLHERYWYKQDPSPIRGESLFKKYTLLDQARYLPEDIVKGFKEECIRLIEKYNEAKNKFGEYPLLNIRKITNQIKDLKKAFKLANSDYVYNCSYMIDVELNIYLKKLVDYLKRIIDHNLDFWHSQVSFWGSSRAINNLSVPVGIAQIYDELTSKKSDALILDNVRNKANYRLGFLPAFFAKRNEGTAQFYVNIGYHLNDNNLSAYKVENTFFKLQKELKLITGVDQKKLCHVECEDFVSPKHLSP